MRLALASLLVGLLALAACSGGDDSDQSPAETSTTDAFFVMEGAGMSPTIDNGQRIEIIPYGDAEPQPGDIVAFLYSGPDEIIVLLPRVFVKRIVAQSGDSVEVRNETGTVVVNGAELDEPYAQGETTCRVPCSWILPPAGSGDSLGECPTICYFVLGDNRQNSSDSRQDWLVPAEDILGWIDR